MPTTRLTTPILKASILCLGGWLTWHLSQTTTHAVTKFDIEEAAEQTQPEVPVHVGVVTQRPMHDDLALYGTVEPAPATPTAPAAGASISVPTRSLVTDVTCIEGQQVKQGQPLFTLDGGKTVNSPLAGTIVRLQIRPGEIARPMVTAVEVVDLNRLVIAVDVPAIDLPRIHIGQSAPVNPGYFNTAASQPAGGALVNRLDEAIDSTTGMGSIDVTAPPELNLRPGQQVKVEISVEDHLNALTVPAESIARDSQGRPAVASLIRQGRWAQLQPVVIGITQGNTVEIQSGNLTAGQAIVTTGAYALPDAAAIRVIKD
jgi:multidrug efflux pump subunit AcrA (membrane-fusion protein)